MIRLAVDIGGTFTDIVLQVDGRTLTYKLLTSPGSPEVAAVAGINTLLQQAGVLLNDVDSIIHGTTLATNALIERKGAKTALVTTQGFRDVLEMRNEKRFDQYSLDIELPEPLVPRELRYTLPERVLVDGTVLKAPAAEDIANLAQQLNANQVEAVAIGFLHSYRYPAHERQVAEQLRGYLDDHITICQSAEVANEIREYDRFSTVCANAYVRPLMSTYLHKLHDALHASGFNGGLLMMLSGGGLTTLAQAAKTPIRLVESGPAGGAQLAASVATQIGSARLLALDIGGTTAKICFIENGVPQTTRRFEIARAWGNIKGSGLPVRVPTIELVEIGAGGGSIVTVDALQRLAVGPHSAGAQPGPCAYAQGGTRATLTDAHIVAGNIATDGFAGGVITLDETLSEAAISHQVATPLKIKSSQSAAAGIIEMADELMANAARVHGIELGKHIETFDLLVSGGGGALHATRIADKLGIVRVVIPENAGVGSAVGFLQAPVAFDKVISILESIDTINPDTLDAQLLQATSEVTEVVKTVQTGSGIAIAVVAELRYTGQDLDFAFNVQSDQPWQQTLAELKAGFIQRYRDAYGFELQGIDIELVSLCVTATVERDEFESNINTHESDSSSDVVLKRTAAPTRVVYELTEDAKSAYRVYQREALAIDEKFSGPAVIAESQTTTIIRQGWSFSRQPEGHLLLERTSKTAVEKQPQTLLQGASA